MGVPQARLPHVLAPSAYASPAHHERELAALFRPGWHCIGTLDDLPRHGAFITLELLGAPLLVRNHHGAPRAFLNVCAHRHSLLTHAPRGTAPRMRCQYHGWEYDGDGAVCKIPDAACFAPARRGGERLHAYRTDTLGRLVFVSLAAAGPSLREHLGERAWTLGERLFSPALRQGVTRQIEHPCNWKIPIENALESYHVPSLHDNLLARHPEIFQLFRAQRAHRAAPDHELGERFTAVHDALGADSALYRAALRRLRPGASVDFVHLHAFPNVFFGHTAVVSFLQVVTPVTPTTSRSLIRLFFDVGQPDRSPVERLLAPLAYGVAGALFDQLMREDTPVFPDVQRGMEASVQPGVLGSLEERIHRFHVHVAGACEAAPGDSR